MDWSGYTSAEHWLGEFYELAMEYHPQGNDQAVLAAIRTIWSDCRLLGPLPPPACRAGHTALPNSLDSDSINSIYGLLKLPDGRMVGCETMLVREECDCDAYLSDWLDLCVPSAMVKLAYPEFKYGTAEYGAVVKSIFDVFVDVAQQVYANAKYCLALVGDEVSGKTNARFLSEGELAAGGVIVPGALVARTRPATERVSLGSDLWWFPITYEPQYGPVR